MSDACRLIFSSELDGVWLVVAAICALRLVGKAQSYARTGQVTRMRKAPGEISFRRTARYIHVRSNSEAGIGRYAVKHT
jgi:hypothetical protein